MASANYTILKGRLGRDVVVQYTAAGAPVINFTLASPLMRGRDKVTSWVDCEAFGDYVLHLAPELKKGVEIFVEGKIFGREFTDKDGRPRKRTEIRVEKIHMVTQTAKEGDYDGA